MKKNIFIFAFISIFLIINLLNFSFVSREEAYVCCQQTLDSGEGIKFCQDVFGQDVGNTCDTSKHMYEGKCDDGGLRECVIGTCIEKSGSCTYASKLVCEKGNGGWFEGEMNEIEECNNLGCCILGGNNYAFGTEKECKSIYKKYKIDLENMVFIKEESENDCKLHIDSQEKGACVYPGKPGERNCNITTEKECIKNKGDFNKGLLCTAELLKTKCTNTTNTICVGDSSYYLDSCSNLGNIVDKELKSQNKTKYWTFMLKPNCTNSNGDENCGNCDLINTLCSQMNSSESKCINVTCNYKGKPYKNGESWCESVNGSNILVNSLNYKEFKNDTVKSNILNNYEKENIPGSRYYQLKCLNGEIYLESCMDYRNQICQETLLDSDGDGEGDYRYAECRINNWRPCIGLTTKSECESEKYDCRWLGGEEYLWGYRYDGQILPWDGESDYQKEIRIEQQGSCVPLYAPGFDFWDDSLGDSSTICSSASITEVAFFETGVFTDREEMENFSTRYGIQKCFDGGCYAIPDFGLDKSLSNNLSDTLNIFLGGEVPEGKIADLHLPLARGYYCENKTGSVTGDDGANCAEDSEKRSDIPLFLNHGLWVDYIQERARASGDCGYKVGISGNFGDESAERLIVQFQKLKQQGEIKDNSSETKVVYLGDKRLTENSNYRWSFLFSSEEGKTPTPFYWRSYNWWKELHRGEISNSGIQINNNLNKEKKQNG